MLLRKLIFGGLLAMGAMGVWMVSSCASGGGGFDCGNGICESFEDSVSCPADCGGSTCGNFICEIGENDATCASDCTGGVCGNAICEASENTITCMVDCICGNNTCDTGESAATCPIDCGTTTCGNGVCDGTETTTTCPQDCTTNPVCGDGVCNGTENTTTCPQDCTTNPVCGDGVCNGAETISTCPADCDISCTDPVCDLYPQCGCTTGLKCTLDGDLDNACETAGSTPAGGTCTAESDCAGGTLCLPRDEAATVGQCLAYCDDATQAGCTGATSYCYELVGEGSIPIPGAAICTITCLPENPSVGCPTGFTCAVYTHPSSTDSFTDCHADVGTGSQGASCDADIGPYCAAGYGCFSDGSVTTCYQWCTGTSGCNVGTCDTAAFEPPAIVGGTTYGICY